MAQPAPPHTVQRGVQAPTSSPWHQACPSPATSSRKVFSIWADCLVRETPKSTGISLESNKKGTLNKRQAHLQQGGAVSVVTSQALHGALHSYLSLSLSLSLCCVNVQASGVFAYLCQCIDPASFMLQFDRDQTEMEQAFEAGSDFWQAAERVKGGEVPFDRLSFKYTFGRKAPLELRTHLACCPEQAARLATEVCESQLPLSGELRQMRWRILLQEVPLALCKPSARR